MELLGTPSKSSTLHIGATVESRDVPLLGSREDNVPRWGKE